MMQRRSINFLLSLVGFALFAATVLWRSWQPITFRESEVEDRVVVSAPVLLALYGGDRFLAANMETIRLSATGVDQGQVDLHYLVRAQVVVAKLNACHEDNYYLANGMLTWGGAVAEGNEVLRRAMNCRFWDGIPPFFYGVNLSFFDHDTDRAVLALQTASERWPENAATLQRLAVMLRAEAFADEHLALNYLVQQRDSSKDPKLRDMLSKRVVRLQGLISLRHAQRVYEQAHGALHDLQQLVRSGVLAALPKDPLKLGYELSGGRIELKEMKIPGMESQR
ncbi:hypothetical protein IB229_20695 [Pseudomonas sp. PDM14]|uniref:hypothetical protein n=1 Tax=Pseudomonas sp. PDM14 TaxID=2769288 RepID=UPI001781F098|nr:hypothetical protein [Pseudomonas sp. PDM14]MBD9485405.1 hypothetical protein [Pseudomonas sp. PDM14]